MVSINIEPLVLEEIASLLEDVLLEMERDTQYLNPDDQEDVLKSVGRMMDGVHAMFMAVEKSV